MKTFGHIRFRTAVVALAAGSLVSVALSMSPAGATTPLTWSAPIQLAPIQGGLGDISCPAPTQCTAVDGTSTGMTEMTFNPVAPGTPTKVVIGTGVSTDSIACPSPTQCTTVGESLSTGLAAEVTFNPQSPSTAETDTYSLPALGSVSCPSTGGCVAAADDGYEVTFYPALPGDPLPPDDPTYALIDGANQLTGIACPALDQCTAVDNVGQEMTFNQGDNMNDGNNPGGITTPITLDPGHELEGIACPGVSTCVAVSKAGNEDTFDPAEPNGGGTLTAIDAGYPPLTAVACPSLTDCVAVDEVGHAIIGDPTTPSSWTLGSAVGPQNFLNLIACGTAPSCSGYDAFMGAIACTSTSVCIASSSEGGQAWVGNPTAPPGTVTIGVTGHQVYGTTPPNWNTSVTGAPTGVFVQGSIQCPNVGNPAVAISPTLPVGSYTIDGANCSGYSLSGTGSSNYAITYSGGTFTVTQAPTKVAASPATVSGTNVTFSAKLTRTTDGAVLPVGTPVKFSSGSASCTGSTTASGVATCTTSALGLGVGGGTFTATFAGNTDYQGSSGSASEPGLASGLLAGLLAALAGLLKGL